MTATTPTASQLLPVSILAGPAGRELVRDIVSFDANCRLGLLASSSLDSQRIHEDLMMEQLASANGGGYDPELIRAQIAAIAEKALVDHLIIECDSRTHPIAFASLFLPHGSEDQRLSEIARLSSILLAVDSETLLSSLVHGRRASGVTSPCILADQIECADVVALGGQSIDRDRKLAQAIISAINPRARIVPITPTTAPPGLVDQSIAFDFEGTFAGAGWRKLMDAEPRVQRGDQGVTTFIYRARRPFHPEKLWNLIQSPFPGVFHAKGFFWLATRMSMVGGLNIAGSECHHSPAGQWWAASGNHSSHPEGFDHINKEWVEPFGDRRQAIALMGVDLDSVELSMRLDACLLSDSEMKSGEQSWATLSDPFPAWSAGTHDHECEDHDCCHH
jgi:G3E family GTPase